MVGKIGVASPCAYRQAAIGQSPRSGRAEGVDVDQPLRRSTFSFMRSISVVPPAMKRMSAPCCAVVGFAAEVDGLGDITCTA